MAINTTARQGYLLTWPWQGARLGALCPSAQGQVAGSLQDWVYSSSCWVTGDSRVACQQAWN